MMRGEKCARIGGGVYQQESGQMSGVMYRLDSDGDGGGRLLMSAGGGVHFERVAAL
jgi:hypothetical protein